MTENEKIAARSAYYKEQIRRVIDRASIYKNDLALRENEHKSLLEGFTLKTSLMDRLGNVLIKDGKIYRGINPYRVEQFYCLWNQGILQALADFNLIGRIAITDYYTNKFPLVIEIEKLLVVDPIYFTFSTLKQISINALIIEGALSHFGHHFLDTAASNFGFRQGNPVLMDIGSMFLAQGYVNGCFEYDIKSNILNRLFMLSSKRSFYARSTTPQIMDIGFSFVDSLEWGAIKSYVFDFHKQNSSETYNDILHKVFCENIVTPEYVDFLFNFDIDTKSDWGQYSDSYLQNSVTSDRFRLILNLIDKYAPVNTSQIIDLGGNCGYFMSLVAQEKKFAASCDTSDLRFQNIINLDRDEVALEKGTLLLNQSGINFFKIGFADLLFSGIKADVTVSLALTHHLMLDANFNMFDVLKTIEIITEKVAFVEFMPLGMYDGNGVLPYIPPYYTEQNFENHFNECFNLLHKEVSAYIDTNEGRRVHRILYIGAKKQKACEVI